jgi:uncharacterized membrane protein
MNSIDARIARILAVGTRVAVALLAIGSILLVAGGTSPLAPDWPPLDPASLPADLLAPILRVVASTLSFGRAGEPRLAALGVAVLVVIALAVVAGLAAG